ncbi:hypothetical protein BD324DRAFT_629565, partial [Kockovaella imperatae]
MIDLPKAVSYLCFCLFTIITCLSLLALSTGPPRAQSAPLDDDEAEWLSYRHVSPPSHFSESIISQDLELSSASPNAPGNPQAQIADQNPIAHKSHSELTHSDSPVSEASCATIEEFRHFLLKLKTEPHFILGRYVHPHVSVWEPRYLQAFKLAQEEGTFRLSRDQVKTDLERGILTRTKNQETIPLDKWRGIDWI